MAGIMIPTPLKYLMPNKRNYEITVRVLRKWLREFVDKDGKKVISSMEMICVDVDSVLIQVTIRQGVVRIFEPLIQEGNTYTFSKFKTDQNIGLERATFHNSKINFQFSTKVKVAEVVNIPSQVNSFVSFEDIIFGNVGNEYYIDVIGVVTMFFEVEENRGYKKMSIEITDEGKRRLRLTVWEAYFPEVQKIVDACKSLQEKPILVIKCVQRKEWHGTVTLSTVRFATKFDLNPKIPEVEAFRNRINEISNNALVGPVGESSVNTSKILTGAKIKSLADILKTTKAGYYVTLIYIEDMNLSHNWYFNSCSECMTKVTKEGDNLWYCKKQSCSKSNVGVEKSDQRFQMKADITDGGDVRAQLMLWDTPIYNIIGKTASTILEEQEQEGHREAVPLQFRGLIEREFVAKFYVSKEFNIEQKSKVFKATQLCADEDVISKWKELEASTKSTEMSQNSTALTISQTTVSQSDVQLLESLKDSSDEELENTPTSKLLLKRSYNVDEDCE